MEKLIEEIVSHLVSVYGGAFSSPSYRILAKRLITRIGKAYVDGELELPGEVGRDVVEASWVDDYLDGGVKVVGDLLPMLTKGDILIALRPLSGTGKEEEQ